MVAGAILLIALSASPAHWSTLKLDSHRQLRYAVVAAISPFRTLLMKVTGPNRKPSATFDWELSGDDPPELHVARWKGDPRLYIVAIQYRMPVEAVLLEVDRDRLRDVWEVTGNPVLGYSPKLLGGPTFLRGRSSMKLRLVKHLAPERLVFECWIKRGRKMVLERYAVALSRARFKLLPRSWGPPARLTEPLYR